ncbi:hypothetical protein BGW41_006990 [Actinomortierella wolfii]|nr:hypothetical protein BGW41_006990 [Actinomortierella wolfii]
MANADTHYDPHAANGSSKASAGSCGSPTSIYREAYSYLDEDDPIEGVPDIALRTGSVHTSRPADNIHMADLYTQSALTADISVPTTAAAKIPLPSEIPIVGDLVVTNSSFTSSPPSLSPTGQFAQNSPNSIISLPISDQPPCAPSPPSNDNTFKYSVWDMPANSEATSSPSPTASSAIVLGAPITSPLPPPQSSYGSSSGRPSLSAPILEPIHYSVDTYQILRNLFNNPLFCDLTLTVGESQFHTHRGILAQQCAYFQEVFAARRALDPTAEIRHLDLNQGGPVPFWVRPSALAMPTLSQVGISDKEGITRECKQEDDGNPQQSDPSTPPSEREGATTMLPILKETGVALSDVQPLPVSQTPKQDSDSERNSVSPPLQKTPPLLPSCFGATLPIDMETLLKSSLHARHFGIFLALIYGVQTTQQIALEDLLPVLHITHAFRGPSYLLISLGHRLVEQHQHRHYHSNDRNTSLTSSPTSSCSATLSSYPNSSNDHADNPLVTPDSWPSLIRFADYYSLDTIRLWAIEWASHDRRLWNTAVGCLELDDYKIFLRGIRSEPIRVKNELLLVFLAFHYQNRENDRTDTCRSKGAVGTSSLVIASPDQSVNDPTSMATMTLRTPTTNGNDNLLHSSSCVSSSLSRKVSITASGTRGGCGRASYRAHHQNHSHGTNMLSVSPLQQLSRMHTIRSLRMDRVNRAMAWMRRLKVECECDDDRALLE